MYLGKLCQFAQECPVYKNESKEIDKPIIIIRNVFCNRGERGWNNCTRHLALEAGDPVTDKTTPYNK